jgi:hypothetical protein
MRVALRALTGDNAPCIPETRKVPSQSFLAVAVFHHSPPIAATRSNLGRLLCGRTVVLGPSP